MTDAEACAAYEAGREIVLEDGPEPVVLWDCCQCGRSYRTRIEAEICELSCGMETGPLCEMN